MERNYLICGLVGWFSAKNNSIDGLDLKIKVDQVLTNSGFPILGTEKDDTQLIMELEASTNFCHYNREKKSFFYMKITNEKHDYHKNKRKQNKKS